MKIAINDEIYSELMTELLKDMLPSRSIAQAYLIHLVKTRCRITFSDALLATTIGVHYTICIVHCHSANIYDMLYNIKTNNSIKF